MRRHRRTKCEGALDVTRVTGRCRAEGAQRFTVEPGPDSMVIQLALKTYYTADCFKIFVFSNTLRSHVNSVAGTFVL